jgi:dephospho-CoA kinase
VVRVALTGGIATGKSTVLRAFAARGVPTIDADVLAREAVAPGAPGLTAVVARFGAHVLHADGSLNRQALAAVVFADPAARIHLEAVIHPAVYTAIEKWFAGLPADVPLGVADIPLLFETGHEHDFDRVLVVACPPEEQIRRAMARDRISEADARARMAAQWPIDEKVARADDVIWSTGPRDDINAVVDRYIAQLAL